MQLSHGKYKTYTEKLLLQNKMENEEESNDWTPEIIRTLIRSVCVLWNGDFQVAGFCIFFM